MRPHGQRCAIHRHSPTITTAHGRICAPCDTPRTSAETIQKSCGLFAHISDQVYMRAHVRLNKHSTDIAQSNKG